jgi:hypothetical protein
MRLQKRVLFWITTMVVLVSVFAVPGLTLASPIRMDSNAAIYPMAVSPVLGVASTFAVLAATPNITDAGGASAIIGDVGLSPATGAGIGLTCAQVTGTIYSVDGAGPLPCRVTNAPLLVNAQAANNAAFLGLSAGANAACTTDYGAITKDLAGLTLVPGVYCANAFALSGTLTLDDTGAPNGVWIFRSAAGLSTTPGGAAKVQFKIGIASSCNVWWGCVSSATIGTGTTFIGNILAHISISLGNGATLNGRAFAYTGAVTMDHNAVTLCTPPPPSTTGLSIFKFNDLNGNGLFEPTLGEKPLAGMQVTITGPLGYSNTSITDVTGLITLTGLTPGTYVVTETAAPGLTIPINPQTVTVSEGNMTPVNFADKQKTGPTVGGTVMPVDKGRLLIPWLGMAGLLLVATGAGLFIRRRTRR